MGKSKGDGDKVKMLIYRFTGKQGPFNVPEEWCRECDLTIREAEGAIEDLRRLNINNIELDVKPWLTRLPLALLKGAWHPPALLIDGKVFSQGVVPNRGALMKELIDRTAPARD